MKVLAFPALALNREMKGLQSNFLRAVNEEPLQLLLEGNVIMV